MRKFRIVVFFLCLVVFSSIGPSWGAAPVESKPQPAWDLLCMMGNSESDEAWLFSSMCEVPVNLKEASVPVFRVTDEDRKEIEEILRESSSKDRYADIRGLDCSQSLIEFLSGRGRAFVLSSSKQELFVKVLYEDRQRVLTTNYWRFWALQSPIPAGFWLTMNGLDFKYETIYRTVKTMAYIYSKDRPLSSELRAVLVSALEPEKPKSFSLPAALAGASLVALAAFFVARYTR